MSQPGARAATKTQGGPAAAPSAVVAVGGDLAATGKGVALFLAALVLFTLMDVAAKDLGHRYPPAQVIWARFAVNLALISLLFRGRMLALAKSRQPGLQLLRGLMQVGTVALFFVSIRFIGLAEAAALSDISPVLITLGAALFLGERLGPRRIAGIAVAFVGAMIVLRPGAGVMHPAGLLAVAAGFAYAGGALLTRVVRFDSTATSVIWSAGVGTALSSLVLPFYWQPVAVADFPVFLAVGALGAAGQALLIVAFRVAEAGAIAPFGYTGLILSSLWGWLFFDQLPDRWTVLGAVVIVAAGLYVWSRERAEALRAQRMPIAAPVQAPPEPMDPPDHD